MMDYLEELRYAMETAYSNAKRVLRDVAYGDGGIVYDATYEAASETAYAALIAYEAQLYGNDTMTNWNHVKNDMARNLLDGSVPADKKALGLVLNRMLDEQSLDADNPILPEEVWWGRSEALDQAHEAHKGGDIALCMNRIKTFYLI